MSIAHALRVTALLLSLSCSLGCNPFKPSDMSGVSADDVFWRAYSGPETFDGWLASQTINKKASSCLTAKAESGFAAERDRRRECNQMASFTSEWTRCHDEADNLHNGGVVANDIARAISGTTRFDRSEGFQYLMFAKSGLSTADWNSFVDQLRRSFPRLEC